MPKAFLVRRRHLIRFLAEKRLEESSSDCGITCQSTHASNLSKLSEIATQRESTLKYSTKADVNYICKKDIDSHPYFVDAMKNVINITGNETNKSLGYFNLLPTLKNGYSGNSEAYFSIAGCGQHPPKEGRKDETIFSEATEKPFGCTICGKTFRLSSTLCRHKIIHTSQRPHKCHVCQKSFNRSSTLKTHLRTHNETKEFVCHVCGKGFHQKGNLRNHVLIHTGEKPYSCRFCNKSFNKLSNLKFHLHSHTDHKPYRCRFCKSAWSRRGELKQHIMIEHHEERTKQSEHNS